MNRSAFVAFLFAIPACVLGKPKKKVKASFTLEPSDQDWVWETGAYRAIWVDEGEFAFLVGPEFPEGIRVLKDSQGDAEFKERLKFIVDTLAGS